MRHATAPRKTIAALVAVFAGLMLFVPTAAMAAAPSNDNFADATSVSTDPPWGPTIALEGNTGEATLEPGEPKPACGFDSIGKTVWFKYRISIEGTYQADTIGSNFDTVIGVYQGDS